MEKNAKKNIGYWKMQPSGCYWYRVKHPMEYLNSVGIPTLAIELDKDVDIDSCHSVQFYGAYPFSMEKVFKMLKEKGIKIVYDCDDALALIDETNPNFYAVKKDLGSVELALTYADEITVSTPEMKKYMETMTNKKISVLPNCYLPSEWKVFKENHDEIRIGFAGSSTHVPDLIEILPTIKKLQDKYNIKFYIMGMGQDTYENFFKFFRYQATDEGKAELVKLDTLLRQIRFEWVPFVDYTVYPQVLTSLSLDIGLCPLKDTPFNRCRSACKSMEYTLSGAVAIASDLAPYRYDKSSMLVEDNDWYEKIESLIHNKEYRASKHQDYLKWLQDNRDISTQLDLLKSIYTV